MSLNKMKKHVIDLIIYGVVVIISAIGLTHKPYTPITYHAKGNIQFAMIQVPVPVDLKMEGQSIDYHVTCTMRKSQLECRDSY